MGLMLGLETMGDGGRGGSLTLSGRTLGPEALNDIVMINRSDSG